MANYRRFVTYFYDYSTGNKGGICGFGKIEYSMRSRIHITMQGNRSGREECVVYGISGTKEPNQILGKFIINYGRGSFLWEWNGKEKNADIFVRNMVGMIVCIGEEQVWAVTKWDGVEFVLDSPCEEKIIDYDEEVQIDESEIVWNSFCQKYAKFMPFPQSSQMECLKIHLGDLRRFSGENRRLASNNFLLRGYYRCHYIVIAKCELKYYIGIPGVYQEREAKLANHFGFCMFVPFKGGEASHGKGGLWMTPFNLMEEKE